MIKKIKTILLKSGISNFLIGMKNGNYSYHYWIFPIQTNKIVISNFVGKPFGDSPKYITNELKNYDKDYEIYWLVSDVENQEHIEGIQYIKMGSFKSKYHLATAKIWLDTARKILFVPKRKNQIYIQLWHGFGPKKAEGHVEAELDRHYVRYAKLDSKMADYMLSPAKTFTNEILPGFWYDGPILEFGLPRNDLLNSSSLKLRRKVEEFTGEKLSPNVILYAPTFRKNLEKTSYDLDVERLKKNLEKRFQKEYSVLVRYHPNIPKINDKDEKNTFIDVSDFPDMTELLSITDCYVTDYSSAMNDFILTNKLILLYASDIEEYNQDRGFYYKLDSVTGFVSQNNDELEDYIKNFDFNVYLNTIKKFKKKHGLNEEFNASKKVADLINKISYKNE